MVRPSTRASTTIEDFEHLLTVVFDDNNDITRVLNDLGIKDRRALTKLTNSPERLKKARWKDGDPLGDELLDENSFEEVQQSTSYLNWVQNNKGTVLRNPISIPHDTDRDSFERFLVLDDSGRIGNGDGTVSYNDDFARTSELHHQIMISPPQQDVSRLEELCRLHYARSTLKMNARRTRTMNTSSASSTHISSNSSGNISNPILDAKHGLSAKDDIAKPERAVTELVHGGSVKHPPRMTEHNKFKAYVDSSDTMVEKSTFLEGGAFGSDGGISFGPSGGNITFPTDQNIESDFRRRVKWRKPYPRGFADKNIESDFRRRVKWKSHQEGSRDCLIFHEVNWGVLVFFIDGVLIPSLLLHLLPKQYAHAHDNQLRHYCYVRLLTRCGGSECEWGVIMSSCSGILLHDRRWQSLAHQLGFGTQLIDVWGDFLPSTLALFKKDSDTTCKYQKNICCYTFSCRYCKSVAFCIDSIIGISSGSTYKTSCGLDICFIILELLPYHDEYPLLELCFKMHGKYGPMIMQQSDCHRQGNFDLAGVGLHRSSHLSYCHPQGHFDLVGVVGLLRMSHLPFSEMKSTFQEYYDIIEFSAQDSGTQLYIVMSVIFHRQLSSNIIRHHSSSQDLRSNLRSVIYSVYNDITSYRYGETLSHRLRRVIYLLGCLSCVSHTLLNSCRLLLTDLKLILFRGTKEFVVVQMHPTATVLLWWITNGAMILAADIVTCMVTICTRCTSWIHGESNFDSGTCDGIICL